ncbi:chemotaxis response regulator containing a CheY-like receiver domain and a methylesterase domain [Candidatus Nitrososphaera evergladensis SR1]|uniref:Protein-glutamate methylesterase/protein-glutamine glutaminase n=1 Tax=Candidatus Nitrososphaera evergladensis SR1 TaxID=1459636 RepID=A0A075MYQ8_9ARCH|nr:chemotaxis response regulator protein-glutamate methylesterase [Candidatus Nitrososphaera evergladensis]AIF84399.1 chemotaxis response regulator containing a CheY-like receiver domain and a methylesterase domain [Candidatus Nitrososphaera evergladensis SR1]
MMTSSSTAFASGNSSSSNDKIQVMIVNDSMYMRSLFSDLISTSQRLQVSDTANDGVDALRKVRKSRPDVVLLDLEMPNMDGLSFIENVMPADPLPVVLVSSYGQKGADVVFDALEMGAVDFVPIPQDDPEKMRDLRSTLVSKLEIAAQTKNRLRLKMAKAARKQASTAVRARTPPSLKTMANGHEDSAVVVIGASTGGPGVVGEIMSRLSADLPAGVLIVQHMPEGFTKSFADRLNGISKMPVREAREGDAIRPGTALLAPGDYHLLVKPSRVVELNKSPRRFGVRPAINMSMVSASQVYGRKTVGVLLTGMGHDGAFGMKMIKRKGGMTVGQDESSSVVFGMAKAAAEMDAVDRLLPTELIPEEIERMVASVQ